MSHYDPKASIFNKKDWWKIVLSGMHLYLPLEPLPVIIIIINFAFYIFLIICNADLGLVAWTLTLWKLGETFGFGLVAALYIPPVLVTNSYLVAITFLQHTDDILPHYDATEWTWLRLALLFIVIAIICNVLLLLARCVLTHLVSALQGCSLHC